MKKLRLYLSEQLLKLATFISPNTEDSIRLQQYVKDYFDVPAVEKNIDSVPIKEGYWYEIILINSRYFIFITPKDKDNFIIAYYNLEETKSILPQLKPIKSYADFLFQMLGVVDNPKEVTDEKDLEYLNFRHKTFLTTQNG